MLKLLNRCSVPALIFALILITLLIFSWPLFLIRLVRAEPGGNGQVDSEILNVELQTAIVSSLDFDRNGIVDSHDFRAFVNHFGTQDEDEKYNAKYDINGNETVDFADFLIFSQNYGKVVNHTPTAISAHPVKVLGDKNIVSGQELVKNQQTGAVDGESSVHIEIAIKESGRILTLSDTLKFAFGTAMPDVLVTVSGGTPHYDQMGIANFPRGIRMDDFHYDSTTGKTMMTVVGTPEKMGVFKIEIDVVDGEQYYMSYFHISVEPVTDMDMPPVFPKNSVVLSLTLDPSTLDPSIILEIDPPVRAYDPNDDKLSYSLMGDDASNFTVNWFGHIKTKAGAVFNKEVYTFTIVVDDSNGGVATAEVTVNIIHPLTPDEPIFARVKPIGTVFVEITWRAPPANDYVIIGYEIQYRKVDEDYNTIIPVNFTRSDMSYTVVGLRRSTTYEFQVRTVFEGGKSNWSPAIRATTGHNTPPVFTSVSAVTFNENSTADIVTVTATDANADDNITGYHIVEGADGSQFEIVQAAGVLSFKVAPNYEDPKDVAFKDVSNSTNNNAGENNEYIVVVEVKSGTGARELTGRDTLTVTVEDVNEAPGVPDAPTVAEATVNSLKVQWSAPDNTGPDISAYDIRYILTNASDKADDNWTVVEEVWTSNNGDDLEYTIGSLEQNTSYDIQVRAGSDEGIGGWSDAVVGMTQANETPVITSASAFSVNENSTADIATVSAIDRDADDDIESYSIVDDADGSQFEIDDQSGVLTFNTAPNYEDPVDVAVTDPANAAENNEYIVIVEATSGTGDRALTAGDTLTVTVEDVNEAPGVPDAPTVASSTFNSLTVEWEAPTNTGPAISAYDVRHILTSDDETDDANWTVKEDAWTSGNGALEYTIASLSSNTSYDVQVRAENDEGTSGWSSLVTGTTQQNRPPFNRGVNLSRWMEYPRMDPFLTYDRQTLVDIKTLGCDVVRVPFRNQMIGEPPSYNIDPLFFTYLDQIVGWAEELGLYIIIDNHNNHSLTSETAEQFLVSVWPQIAEHYKDRSNRVMYEILNEPNISSSIWNPIQQRVIDTIRVHDDTHTIVVTGGMFHQGALQTLPEYTDNNLLYTFHFYSPVNFTHQGANWSNQARGALSNVPWPYDAARMPDPLPEILDNYSSETLARMQERLDDAIEFAQDRNVPVWCGEFGVYLWHAPPADRVEWIREARTYMEENNIAWTLWEYDGGFGMFEYERGSDNHFDYDFNVPLLEALGLVVPPQLEWVIESKQAGFEIYTDGLAQGIFARVQGKGWLDFEDNSEAAVGNSSIYWSEASRFDGVGFDFSPNLDLSQLVDDYALEFWIWGNTPGMKLQVRFIDSYNAYDDNLPWRMRYNITEANIGITWDSQWHFVSIPLKDFRESGASVGGDYYSPRGEFTWDNVNRVVFVAEQMAFGNAIFRLDDIKISSNVAP